MLNKFLRIIKLKKELSEKINKASAYDEYIHHLDKWLKLNDMQSNLLIKFCKISLILLTCSIILSLLIKNI